MQSFNNSFWGENERGLEVLMQRMKMGKHINEQIFALFKERALIEEEYSKRLSKLHKNFIVKEEIGTLRSALDVLKNELEISSKSHNDMAIEIKNQLEKQTQDFIIQQSGIRKSHQVIVEKIQKNKSQLISQVLKTKEKYELKCQESLQLLQMRKNPLPPKEAERTKKSLDKAQQLANQLDFDYLAGVEKLQEVHKKWEEDMRTCCTDCQKLEEDRIDYLRTKLWTYANLISTTCVSDGIFINQLLNLTITDEGCERIRVSLEKCDIEKDIQEFLEKSATGSEIPPPLQYINFYTQTNERPISGVDQLNSLKKSVSQLTLTPGLFQQQQLPQYNSSNKLLNEQLQFSSSIESRSVKTFNEAITIQNDNLSRPGVNNNTLPRPVSVKGNVDLSNETYFHYDPYDIEDQLKILFSVKVLYDYQAQAFEELNVKKDQIISVIAKHDDGWWEGIIMEEGKRKKGLFPSNFVEKC
ncbi:hypothetical protein HK099_003797 [Clydaea vesicula]|uniref:Uncharacterized protein n=1 Tax=Clydaea vesicula TaxID=447962 RepID=A0AAD5U349_9FUNG|nr:hypothetical protein HK099_003797 [Clydaea vesicula]